VGVVLTVASSLLVGEALDLRNLMNPELIAAVAVHTRGDDPGWQISSSLATRLAIEGVLGD
jgi:hypothetical protein